MQMAKSNNGTKTTTMGTVRSTRENSGWKNSIAIITPTTIRVYSADRNRLNGTQTFNRVRSPVNPVKMTAKVEICSLGRWRNSETATNYRMLVIIVIAPGKDFRMILTKNFPRIRSLFGSKARIKEGIPIVKVLISVN